MTRFFIIRHGETVWNAEGRIQGHLDVELTELGIEQARLAAQRLRDEPIAAVYASDLKRASVTGGIIAETHGLPTITTPLLREACLGEWQGLTTEEAAQRFPEEYAAYSKDSIGNRPPGAEKLEDVIARCAVFLDMAKATNPKGDVAVAAHGGAVRGILAAAFGVGPDIYRRVRIDNGSITVLEIKSGRSRNHRDMLLLVSLNDTCHLGS